MQPGSAFVFVFKECISPAVKEDGRTAFFLHKQLPHDKWTSSVPSEVFKHEKMLPLPISEPCLLRFIF